MEKYKIIGGNRLEGSITLHGAKNAFLPIMAGSILADGKTILDDYPIISDINKMSDILVSLGCDVKFKDRQIVIDTSSCNKFSISSDLMQGIRASIFMLGPILSRFKKAKMAYPGGCAIGNRPIDIHLDGLKALNVKITEEHGQIICDGSNMKSGHLHLKFASVGATENLVMASVLLKGTTIIDNVAREPEVVDLCNFLNKMGANIKGIGTSCLVINGVKSLKSVSYKPIADRIVAGTYLIAGLMTKGNIEICNINPQYLTSLINLFADNNCYIKTFNDKIIVESSKQLKSVPLIETLPYPHFPTDLQPQIMALMSVSNGVSVITENLFDSRFKQASELIKMGANIKIENNKAIIKGVKNLSGAEVLSTDLRAGASLVLAGLVADGYTTVGNIHYIGRGYENIQEDLNNLGAKISKIEVWYEK